MKLLGAPSWPTALMVVAGLSVYCRGGSLNNTLFAVALVIVGVRSLNVVLYDRWEVYFTRRYDLRWDMLIVFGIFFLFWGVVIGREGGLIDIIRGDGDPLLLIIFTLWALGPTIMMAGISLFAHMAHRLNREHHQRRFEEGVDMLIRKYRGHRDD